MRDTNAMSELSPVQIATVAMAKRYEAILLNHREEALWGWFTNPNVDKDGLLWLCETIIAEIANMPIDKASRWLGFVQGQLIACGNASTHTERNLSRPVFHKAYLAAGIPVPPTRERPKEFITQTDLLAMVTGYLDRFPRETAQNKRLIDQIQIERHHVLRRTNIKGHITTSALIFNRDFTHVFLIFHKKYQIWLCPGGHYEGDKTLIDSAIREAFEETGLVVEPMRISGDDTKSSLINIDTHMIPSRPDENQHFHHDFMFACATDFEIPPNLQLDEVEGGAWIRISDLSNIHSDQIVNVLPKIINGL